MAGPGNSSVHSRVQNGTENQKKICYDQETADAYSFQDNDRALQKTFSQIRSLMNILDSRILLLEKKFNEMTIVFIKMNTTTSQMSFRYIWNTLFTWTVIDCSAKFKYT